MSALVLQTVLSGSLSYLVLSALLRWGLDVLPVDSENHRSLHSGEIPRIGGIGILVGALGAVWQLAGLSSETSPILLLAGASILGIVSLVDDFRSMSSWSRLLVQIIAAGLLVAWSAGTGVSLTVFGLSLVGVVWAINLYNFMDGMDGFAATMGVIGFVALGVLGLLSGASGYAVSMTGIAGAAAGFLIFNFPPARIFMGDVGSTFLGYIMAAASLWGIKQQIFPFWAPLLIFAPFWLDATITLLRRLFRGERIWEAHRSHFYQRAVLAGIPVRRVLLVEVMLMLGCSTVAVIGVILLGNGN